MNRIVLCLLYLCCCAPVFAQTFSEKIKILSPHRSSWDEFGEAVAISGNYALVGVQRESEDENGANTIISAGAAYIYEKDSLGRWSRVQKLLASDRGHGDDFGRTVAISGNYAIAGAWFEDEDVNGENTIDKSGSAYIFERDETGVWTQVQKLTAYDRGENDRFGHSVGISGNHAIVGAIWEDEDLDGNNTLNFAGSAYLFERDGEGNWALAQKIIPSDRANLDFFGHAVAISGTTAIVSASQKDYVSEEVELESAGTVYIFEKNEDGIWVETQKIFSNDLEAFDRFGEAITINDDYLLVGRDHEGENEEGVDYLTGAGAAYVFERDALGSWQQVQKITPSDRNPNDLFGASVSIYGNRALIGAYGKSYDVPGADTVINYGAVYLFERDNEGNWTELQKVEAMDRDTQDFFGRSVALAGEDFIVGASGEDHDENGENFIYQAGSAYMFSICQIENSIFIDNNILYATEADVAYQWVHCDNDLTSIPGAINPSFQPLENGDYAVIIDNGDCVEISDCLSAVIVNTHTVLDQELVRIYPNPFQDYLKVTATVHGSLTYQIHTVDGKIMDSGLLQARQSIIDTHDLLPGFYVLNIASDEGSWSFKVIKG